MIENKKYMKEVSSLYVSANKVKKIIVAELAKIDEKYRKLAEEEKKKLNGQLEVIDMQLKCCNDILTLDNINGNQEMSEENEAVESAEQNVDVADSVEEEKIVDTIFPDNLENVSDTNEDVPEEEFVESKSVEEEVVVEDVPGVSDEEKKEPALFEWPDNDNLKIGDDGWPEWPEA